MLFLCKKRELCLALDLQITIYEKKIPIVWFYIFNE